MDTLLSPPPHNLSVQMPPDLHARIMKKVGYSVAHRRILWALILLLALIVPINVKLVADRVDNPFVSALHLHTVFGYAPFQSFGMITALFIISIVGAGVFFSILKNKYCNQKAHQFSQKAPLKSMVTAQLSNIMLLACIIELISVSTCISAFGIHTSARANPFVSMQAFAQIFQTELTDHTLTR